MCSNGQQDKYTTSKLIFKLCSHLTKQKEEGVTPFYQFALKTLGSSLHSGDHDEFVVVEKVKKKLIREKRERDCLLFGELHRKLQTSTLLKNRSAVLVFLLDLTSSKNKNNTKGNVLSSGLFAAKYSSTPQSGTPAPLKIYEGPTLSSIHNFSSQPYYPVETPLPVHIAGQDPNVGNHTSGVGDKLSLVNSRIETAALPKYIPGHVDVNENELVRDILFAFQGIEGKIIKLDSSRASLAAHIKLSSQQGMKAPIQALALRLCELGWLYRKIANFCESRAADRALGLVGQSLVAALKEELHQYYRLLALLDSQIEAGGGDGKNLTLRRLVVWTLEPFTRLRTLACLIDACKDVKGGALASTLYSFLWHGDPSVKDLIKTLLSLVIQPIYKILSHWIFCGELDDKYDEFFVAANIAVNDNALWQEKYGLRKDMVPSFFTMEQASMILSTGKAINFLREICHDHTCVQAEKVSTGPLDANTVDSLLRGEHEGEFQSLLEATYCTTSKHVLWVLHSRYHFMDHLRAVRSYLLLGQGDFVRHLMDLLENELSKPANLLYLHNLSGILETAVRATNAQFDSPDVLHRLDVRLLDVTAGDTGWDVFSLDYHVDGPIGTVFTAQCMMSYLRLFHWLWRAKRMEYVLAGMWKNHTMHTRHICCTPSATKLLPQLGPVIHQAHVLLSAMVHFVQQMQYYIAFEVMECSWAELVQKVNAAQDLDQVINAHVRFLETLLTRALLDPASKELLSQLGAIYDVILQFQAVQEKFWHHTLSELETIMDTAAAVEARTRKGKWGMTEEQAAQQNERHAHFLNTSIPLIKTQLHTLSYSYEEMVQKFLIMLTDTDDPNLHLLSFRLDFNEHYKSKNTRLQTSLTYQHQRRSLR